MASCTAAMVEAASCKSEGGGPSGIEVGEVGMTDDGEARWRSDAGLPTTRLWWREWQKQWGRRSEAKIAVGWGWWAPVAISWGWHGGGDRRREGGEGCVIMEESEERERVEWRN